MRIKYMDPEWDEAAAAKERPEYYFCKMVNGGECIKCYKPSLAKVVLARGAFTKMQMVPTKRPEEKRKKRSYNRDERKRAFKPYYQPYELSMLGLRR